MEKFVQEGEFEYWEEGTGSPLVILHGLMGDISNFHHQVSYFSQHGYRVLVPHLPLYSLPLATTGVKSLTKWVKQFLDHLNLESPVLLGNSLGGHIALVFNKLYPGVAKGMVLFGSSGLYESAMGNSYPRRGDYSYIEERVKDVFFQKQVVTKDLVDEVFSIVNDRMKAIKTLAISKSAIRHNMAEDLPKFTLPTCIIWGRQDAVTPPEVAYKFNELLPNSELHWIDQCGHAPMMEHPEQFNKLLSAWLEKTYGAPQATPAIG
jgi:pimeloyl-ACP methyl ester carboxylesterase